MTSVFEEECSRNQTRICLERKDNKAFHKPPYNSWKQCALPLTSSISISFSLVSLLLKSPSVSDHSIFVASFLFKILKIKITTCSLVIIAISNVVPIKFWSQIFYLFNSSIRPDQYPAFLFLLMPFLIVFSIFLIYIVIITAKVYRISPLSWKSTNLHC